MYCFIFDGLEDESRHEALRWLFVKNLTIQLKNDVVAKCVYVRKPDMKPKMVCFFMLVTPDVEDISTWKMIKNGMFLFPLKFGLRACQNLLKVKDYIDGLTNDYIASKQRKAAAAAVKYKSSGQYCILERMVVHPSFQSKGIGSHYLKKALLAGDVQFYILQTQEKQNVTFYSRLGFEVVNKDEANFSCTNWVMVKE